MAAFLLGGRSGNVYKSEAVMRTEGYATPAMDTYARQAAFPVNVDGLHRTGGGAFAATDAQGVLFPDAAAFALRASPCRTCLSAGRRIAGLAQSGFKACAEAP